MSANILLLDIETKPHIAYVWGLFKQNVGLNQLVERGDIISFGYKWLGEEEIHYVDDWEGKSAMLETLYVILNRADIIIGHNGDRFDLPWINSFLIRHNFRPVSPSFTVDTLKVAKKAFRFTSNKLENLAIELDCTPKESHAKFPGFALWSEYLKGNEEARAEMDHYCRQDVGTLEEIYLKLRPYIKNHPNVSLFEERTEDRPHCSKCGSHKIQYRGYATTAVSKFRRYVCTDCGGWGRERTNTIPKENRHTIGTNIASGL